MSVFLNTYKAKFSIICILFLYTSCCSLRGTEVKEYYFKTILAEKFIPNLPDSLNLHLDAHIPFYSSITLLSRTFNDVYIFETNVVTDKKYPQQIYYNTEQGIVGIRFNNHDFWELLD